MLLDITGKWYIMMAHNVEGPAHNSLNRAWPQRACCARIGGRGSRDANTGIDESVFALPRFSELWLKSGLAEEEVLWTNVGAELLSHLISRLRGVWKLPWTSKWREFAPSPKWPKDKPEFAELIRLMSGLELKDASLDKYRKMMLVGGWELVVLRGWSWDRVARTRTPSIE